MPSFPGLARQPNPDAGVRGWLAFFLFGACMAALIRAWVTVTFGLTLVSLLASSSTSGLFIAITAAFVLEAVLLVFNVLGIRLILRADATTPGYWATFLLASTPALLLFDVCVAYGNTFTGGAAFGEGLADLLLKHGGLRGILTSTLWALYWMRSNRVRDTYGCNAFEKQVVVGPKPV